MRPDTEWGLFIRAGTLALAVVLFVVTGNSPAGTLGLWRFEEPAGPALDSAGNQTLTPFGNPVRSGDLPTTPYANTMSASFDGSGDVFAANGGVILNNAGDDPFDPGAGDFTLEGFIKPISGTGFAFGKSFTSGSASEDKGFQVIAEDQGNGMYRLRFGVRTTAGGFFDSDTQSAPTGLAYGEWHHVAAVRSGDDLFFYVDGNLEGQRLDTVGGRDFRSRVPFTIGSNINGGSPGGVASFGNTFNGFIDEVRLSDLALEPSQFLINVPEPATLSIMSGLALCLCRRRSRRRTG